METVVIPIVFLCLSMAICLEDEDSLGENVLFGENQSECLPDEAEEKVNNLKG